MIGGGNGRGNPLNINLTPMIDCTMLLVIFFLLATQLASADFVQLNLPAPRASVARSILEGNKAVINVVPLGKADPAAGTTGPGQILEYRLGTLRFQREDLPKMAQRLRDARALSQKPADFTVVIRSDQRLDFTEVEPLFTVLQDAQIARVELAALRNTGGD